MKMPFERVKAEGARYLASMAAEAMADVTVDGTAPLLCGLDSDMQPTANVNDARWLVVTIPMGNGQMGMGMLKIGSDGLMHHMRVGQDG